MRSQAGDPAIDDKILSSPSAVNAVIAADRKREAEEQAYRDQKAKQELAERIEQTKQRAEDARLKAEKQAEADAEDAREERKAKREARERWAAWRAAFGLPPDVPNSPSSYSPYVPAYSYTSPDDSSAASRSPFAAYMTSGSALAPASPARSSATNGSGSSACEVPNIGGPTLLACLHGEVVPAIQSSTDPAQSSPAPATAK
jgi:hypothetical protein